MAYDTSNPPIIQTQEITANGIWLYKSADTAATVKGANYFSNGSDLRMKVGDALIIVDTATPATTLAQVTAVTAGGAATVS